MLQHGISDLYLLCVCVAMCVHMCVGASRPGALDLLESELHTVVSCQAELLESNSGLQAEQKVLLTPELSLKSPGYQIFVLTNHSLVLS